MLHKLLIGIAIAWWLLATIYDFQHPESNKRVAVAGDRCGPAHHWITTGTPLNQDLSCERDPP